MPQELIIMKFNKKLLVNMRIIVYFKLAYVFNQAEFTL